MTKRILLVCMPDSVHVGRWLEMHKGQDYSVFIFPSSPMRRTHAKVLGLLDSPPGQLLGVTFPRIFRALAIPLWVLDRRVLFNDKIRSLFIKSLIKRWKPDLLHIMETQNGGYPASIALDSLSPEVKPKVLLTLFGSDLFWYGRFESHRGRIEGVLKQTDFLAVECSRDEKLSRNLGFKGQVLPAMPVSGGLESAKVFESVTRENLTNRRIIAVKGYGGKWGQGALALKALALVQSDILDKFEVVVFSAERSVRGPARALRKTGAKITFIPKFGLSHQELLNLMAKSRVFIGLSKSDGLPASVLEAMSQGAFPIQTSTACVDGWFLNGISGFSIDAIESSELARKIEIALTDDDLVFDAQLRNLGTIRSRYRLDSMKTLALRVYLSLIP